MIDFGRTIRKYRERAKITQHKLAERLGITPTYLSTIENSRKEPSLGLIKDICKALDIPQEVMFWESVEIEEGLKPDERKAIEIAKVIVKHYFEAYHTRAT